MSDAKPSSVVLTYATPAPLPARQSPFAIASLIAACVAAIWQLAENVDAVPFTQAWVSTRFYCCELLAIALAIASYVQPFRRRGLSHVAITVSALVFLFNTYCVNQRF